MGCTTRPPRSVPTSAALRSSKVTPETISMAYRFSVGMGMRRATALCVVDTTHEGESGTSHPVLGQTTSTQYKNALARFPSLSFSIPRVSILALTAASTFICAFFICSCFSLFPTMLNAPHVSMQAIGFRSEAYTSQPDRAASKGMEPPPANVSATLGL